MMASCTATPNDPTLGLAVNSTVEQPMSPTASLAGEQDAYIRSSESATAPVSAEPAADKPQSALSSEALPAEVAFAPTNNAVSAPIAAIGQADGGVPSLANATLTIPAQQPAQPAKEQAKPTEVAVQQPEAPAAPQAVATAVSADSAASLESRFGSAPGMAAKAAPAARQVASASGTPDDKRGFLSPFFSADQSAAAPAPVRAAATSPLIAEKAGKRLVAEGKSKPLVQMASVSPSNETTGTIRSESALPGVRTTALFEISRKSGIDDDSDVDIHEGAGSPVRVASAAGLARLAPNGLLKQTAEVDTACLKPSLVRVLKTVEQHYGKKAVVTSGYRDPSRNQKARGARNSLHMFCAAADVQIEGVSKWELATYVRSMPGRGGVGTYCHTDSVHIDVGPERDWNWRCRRKK